MNKEEFSDYKKSIELVMGDKMKADKDAIDLFEKHGVPLIKALREMAKKDNKKAFMTMTTLTATLVSDLTPEGKKLFIQILAMHMNDDEKLILQNAGLSQELFKRLRKEREK